MTTNEHQIQVNADAWRALLAARAKATAADRERKALEEALGIHDAEALAARMGLPKGTKGQAVVIDGNGQPIGKLTLSFQEAAIINRDEYWRKNIS